MTRLAIVTGASVFIGVIATFRGELDAYISGLIAGVAWCAVLMDWWMGHD